MMHDQMEKTGPLDFLLHSKAGSLWANQRLFLVQEADDCCQILLIFNGQIFFVY